MSQPGLVSVGSRVRGKTRLLVGTGQPARVICHIGVTPGFTTPEAELAKATDAVAAGADMIADHTISTDALGFICSLLQSVDVPVSTVPFYAAAVYARENRGSIAETRPDDLIRVVEAQADAGVDMMTVHASLTLEMLQKLATSPRVMPMTSRGGTWMAASMLAQNADNAALAVFDRILEVASSRNVCLSLGPSLRPGTIADGLDDLVWAEIGLQGQLVDRCLSAGVQVMVEYGGHVKLDQIGTLIRTVKRQCRGVPVRPLIIAMDIAVGFDHIAAAIAGAQAVASGADLLATITRAEHIGLPRPEDIAEGVLTARIAAHVGDTVRTGDDSADERLSRFRTNRDWPRMMEAAMAPELSSQLHNELQRGSDVADYCTMCGDLCAHKVLNEFVKMKRDDQNA